jgi:hypothetical protein
MKRISFDVPAVQQTATPIPLLINELVGADPGHHRADFPDRMRGGLRPHRLTHAQVSCAGGLPGCSLGAASITFAGRLDPLPKAEAAARKPSIRPSSAASRLSISTTFRACQKTNESSLGSVAVW